MRCILTYVPITSRKGFDHSKARQYNYCSPTHPAGFWQGPGASLVQLGKADSIKGKELLLYSPRRFLVNRNPLTVTYNISPFGIFPQ